MFPFLLRFQKPQTIVEVGAFSVDDKLIDACRRYRHHLYLFEPNPQRVAELRRKTAGAPTIHVLPLAVSNYDGRANFHISCYDDCSSLQDFDDGANRNWVHPWHPYKHFEMVNQVEVEVTRLDTFFDRHGIRSVDLLEIDAQGEDLRVVESLGERIRDVGKIQIEVNIHSSPLYRNSFSRAEAETLFAANGFESHVSWKQSMNREENIVFRNRRFYPHSVLNRLTSSLESFARSAYFAWVKLPRVIAVTGMVLRHKMRGQRVEGGV